jgi:anti-sigma-K factor RskA
MTWCDDHPDERTSEQPNQPEWASRQRRIMPDISFRGMREQVLDACAELHSQLLDKESDTPDELVVEVITTIAQVAVLTHIQIAQELNEIKHMLATQRAERKFD